MRINVIIPYDGLGGGIRIIAGYCNHLARRGHEVFVLPGRPPGRRFRKLKNLMMRFSRSESYFDWNLVHRIDIDFDCDWRQRVPHADVLISTWYSVVELAATLPRKHGRLFHMIQGDERVLHCPPDRVMAMWRVPGRRIAVSDWIARVVQQETGLDDIAVVRNAVDTDLFDAPVRAKNGRPTLGYIFSTHECKGGDVAAAVIERVRNEIPNLDIVCFGSIRPRLTGMQPPKGVRFIHRPRQKLIPQLYASCDVWLSTSRSEGSCLPPQEAMACRTPAVVTDVGDFGTPGLFGPGCFVSHIEDVDGLAANALHVLRSDPAAWSRLSQSAWQAIRSWTWEDATDALENILQGEHHAPIKSVA